MCFHDMMYKYAFLKLKIDKVSFDYANICNTF